jgi:hypothetical protein
MHMRTTSIISIQWRRKKCTKISWDISFNFIRFIVNNIVHSLYQNGYSGDYQYLIIYNMQKDVLPSSDKKYLK